MQYQEPRSQGALRQPDESVLWRLWAARAQSVSLVLGTPPGTRAIGMTPSGDGCYEHHEADAADGVRYAFALDDAAYPDPASRWQPDGVHQASAVFSPERYSWSDGGWQGVAREDLVLYELHVGTFTPAGTFADIVPRLPELAALGVTALEIMPVAQFPGARNWGYDGVHPYAVQNSYGGPRAFQAFVDAAHRQGLAVILDVVYNHLGPEGNYLAKFGPYFTNRYYTPWGEAVNFDGPGSDAVRQFVVENACMWVRDFHVDGLRLDAVHAIYDFSPRHILAEIGAAVQQEARRQQRLVHVIAESNQNDVRLVSPPERGGYGLDGVWSDDFHHSVHALLTGERNGYYLDFGCPEDVAKAMRDVFVYDGRFSPHFRRRQGSAVGNLDRTRFVVCIQNHDQAGNRARGDRLSSVLPPAAQRLACGLLLLSPCVPLLFMGEEYGETSCFPFFCSFQDPALAAAVRLGRAEGFAASMQPEGETVPDPQSAATFAAAKLNWSWPGGTFHAQLRRLYGDLLRARREWPALRERQCTTAHLWGDAPADRGVERAAVLIVERGADRELTAIANLTPHEVAFPATELAVGPLLLSTENVCYGGLRETGRPLRQLLPYELLVLSRQDRTP